MDEMKAQLEVPEVIVEVKVTLVQVRVSPVEGVTALAKLTVPVKPLEAATMRLSPPVEPALKLMLVDV